MEGVDGLSEISVGEEALKGLFGHFDVLELADVLKFSQLMLFRDRFESEFNASRGNWLNDSVLFSSYFVMKLQIMANLTVLA